MSPYKSVPSWASALADLSKCTNCNETYVYRAGETTTRLCQKCNPAVKPEPKTKLPPTERQLERINELKDLPEFKNHLDWLLTAVNKGMLNTRGQAGILISQMKKKLNDDHYILIGDGEDNA